MSCDNVIIIVIIANYIIMIIPGSLSVVLRAGSIEQTLRRTLTTGSCVYIR